MMGIGYALKLLDIKDYSRIDMKMLRSAYITKMKECHPDLLTGTEDKAKNVGLAYEVLKDIIGKTSTREELQHILNMESKDIKRSKQRIIAVEDIVKVYKGMDVFDSAGTQITKASLREGNVTISVDVQISLNGETLVKNYLLTKTISDKYAIAYELCCRLGDRIQVKILDQIKDIEVKSSRSLLHYSFNYLVEINLSIDRKDSI